MEAVHVGILSIIPPVIAIALALITKEVVFSLLLGIMSGTIIYSIAAGMGFVGIFSVTADLMISKVSDNASMVIFLAMLGALVAVITRAGGSRAYGNWASRKLKTRRSAAAATGLLGILIFVDDYFNCLTVGTVMKPVTDRHHLSREKLAFIIDATAAPVCIIAPISSWAASVISYYPGEGTMGGMQAFISSIPMNLYAVLMIFMVFWMALRKNGDFGPMARAQRLAEERGDAHFEDSNTIDNELTKLKVAEKGKVWDLVVPVVFLVIFAVLSMLYYGGYWDGEGKSLFDAFGDTDAGYALSLGGFGALFVAFFLFVPRKLMTFREFFATVTAGVKSMVPALIILALAWTISGVCRDLLSTGPYVAGVVERSNLPVAFIPAIMFVIAAFLSFATGTSWGTFGILIPITVAVCEIVAPHLSVITLSSVLAGSVFGDHCSPISDTTILSSTGAGCDHIAHVETQIPYALTVAAVCFVGYIIAGFTAVLGFGVSVAITTPVSLAMLIAALLVLPKIMPGKPKTA
ncbi:Na+/H+ antiporter NhaC family protein [Breznakiella homolactica]|uniref:Na+/H+ antiporter NhaC family protein n=1 Tax=Breznakiella homolactica TaxID=2798577 RepID=A0A7T7XL15_9SPIR|nr:Na+/H+ antiporter NhaC family protein [Breznakiella homolactica]QQO08260.1 Na+/H+ antiporter NhaC family protein [Breznakiella homolactica]